MVLRTLQLSVLVLEPEAVAGTREALMQEGDEREEHLTRHELVDVLVLFKVYRFSQGEH